MLTLVFCFIFVIFHNQALPPQKHQPATKFLIDKGAPDFEISQIPTFKFPSSTEEDRIIAA